MQSEVPLYVCVCVRASHPLPATFCFCDNMLVPCSMSNADRQGLRGGAFNIIGGCAHHRIVRHLHVAQQCDVKRYRQKKSDEKNALRKCCGEVGPTLPICDYNFHCF